MNGFGVNVMQVERWGVPNSCELVLVASDRTIRTQPVFVREVVQPLQEGYAYAPVPPSVWIRPNSRSSSHGPLPVRRPDRTCRLRC
ncbi:MAG: hypothetical protein PVSMB7_28550 [Chloroflexota bacterium]